MASFFAALAAAALAAQQQPAYPEGAAVPRSLTPAEAAYIAAHPLGGSRAVTPPPSGPVHCAAEYEPMDALLIAWEGTSSWTTILAKMAAQITTTGDADVYCAVDSSSEISSASSKIQAEGANMSRVYFPVVTTDTIWIRDYGPRYVYQGGVRCIVDHTYNRPRPQDDKFPSFFSGYKGHAFYQHQLVHGGGNFHLDARTNAFTTRLINNENPGLSEQQIHDVFADYLSVDTNFYTPLPQSVDSTQHIDMWLQVVADDVVVVSDWPAQSGTTQDNLCDAAALDFANRGYTVFRVPARTSSGTHYTYTNVVLCNDLVLIPSYTNGTISQYNAQALATWQAACPGKTVVQVNSEAIVSAAGVLHCIVMHLPAYLSGADPISYLVGPNGGQIYAPGSQVTVEWVSDDDVAVSAVDLQLSTDGGLTWPTTVASNRPPNGSYAWTVPALHTSRALLRAVARDGGGRLGADASDLSFAIAAANEAAYVPYGQGKAGSLGVPLLDLAAAPVLGTTGTLLLSQALPNGAATLLRGPSKAALPFDGGTVLVDYDATFPLAVNAAGQAALSAGVPNVAALAGRSFYWQALVANDPGAAGQGWALSNGLETRLGY